MTRLPSSRLRPVCRNFCHLVYKGRLGPQFRKGWLGEGMLLITLALPGARPVFLLEEGRCHVTKDEGPRGPVAGTRDSDEDRSHNFVMDRHKSAEAFIRHFARQDKTDGALDIRYLCFRDDGLH